MLKNYFLNDHYAKAALAELEAHMYSREELLAVPALDVLHKNTYWLQYRKPGNSKLTEPQVFGTPFSIEDHSHLLPVIRVSNLGYPEIGIAPTVARGVSALRLLKVVHQGKRKKVSGEESAKVLLASLLSTPSEWRSKENTFFTQPQIYKKYIIDRYSYGAGEGFQLTIPASATLGALGVIGQVKADVDLSFFGIEAGGGSRYKYHRRPNSKFYAIFRALMGTAQDTKTAISMLGDPQPEAGELS